MLLSLRIGDQRRLVLLLLSLPQQPLLVCLDAPTRASTGERNFNEKRLKIEWKLPMPTFHSMFGRPARNLLALPRKILFKILLLKLVRDNSRVPLRLKGPSTRPARRILPKMALILFQGILLWCRQIVWLPPFVSKPGATLTLLLRISTLWEVKLLILWKRKALSSKGIKARIQFLPP